jgi:DNA-binding XRE family transcriptional regulator
MKPMKECKISLKAARVNANLTILQAAKHIGVGKDTLIKWEKHPDRVEPRYQRAISLAYQFPIDNIFFGPLLENNSSA